MENVLVLIGRILFVALFLNSAFAHLSQSRAMAGFAGAKGVPAPHPAVLGSGVLLLLGSISVLLGIFPDIGVLLLLVFLVPTALTMHAFWKESDPAARQNDMIHFLKNLALAGAALMLLGLFWIAGDRLGLTVTGPAF